MTYRDCIAEVDCALPVSLLVILVSREVYILPDHHLADGLCNFFEQSALSAAMQQRDRPPRESLAPEKTRSVGVNGTESCSCNEEESTFHSNMLKVHTVPKKQGLHTHSAMTHVL